MGVTVTVRIGGAADSTLWDATAQVPLFDESSDPMLVAGMQCDNGGACQWEFTVVDVAGEIPRADLTKNLASHNVVTVIEDAPGFDCWIGRGRVADKGIGRGQQKYGDARTFKVTVDDGNSDVSGLALVADWDRPEESGRARVLAALAAFCNASPRLTTVIATHLVAAGGEVTMPAKKYLGGTDLKDIFRDCAQVEGKVWSVVIHHLADVSHLCFLYVDEEDHTTYASGLSITDDAPDYVTSFPPIWDQGDAAIESGGDNPVSHLVNRYGAEDEDFVVSSDTDIVDAYDYWAVSNNDSLSETPAQAATRAAAERARRGREHVTHQVSILIGADQVDQVAAGMSIDIKSAASMGGQYLGTTQTRRIAQCKFEKVSPTVASIEGYYLAHLQLDRPEKVLNEGPGLPVGVRPSDVDEAIDEALGTLIASCLPGSETPVGGFPWDWTGGTEPSTTGFGSCAGPASRVWGEGIDTDDPDGGNSEFLNHDAGCKDFAVTPGDLLLVSITGAILGYPPPAAVKLTMTYFDGACTVVAADEQFITLGAWSNFDFAWHGGWETGTGQFVVPVGATRASMRLGTDPVGFTGWLQGASVSISTPPTGECYQEEGA